MMFAPLGKMLIGAGASLLLAGVIVMALGKFGLGRLPGDIELQRGRFTFAFPIVTCLVLSVVLSIIMSLLGRWRR